MDFGTSDIYNLLGNELREWRELYLGMHDSSSAYRMDLRGELN